MLDNQPVCGNDSAHFKAGSMRQNSLSVIDLYLQHQIEDLRINIEELSEEETNLRVERLAAIEADLMSLPSGSAMEWLMKAKVASRGGECGLPTRAAAPNFWREAERFILEAMQVSSRSHSA